MVYYIGRMKAVADDICNLATVSGEQFGHLYGRRNSVTAGGNSPPVTAWIRSRSAEVDIGKTPDDRNLLRDRMRHLEHVSSPENCKIVDVQINVTC